MPGCLPGWHRVLRLVLVLCVSVISPSFCSFPGQSSSQKAKSQCLFRCTSRAIRYIQASPFTVCRCQAALFSRNVSVPRTITVTVNENTRVCSLRFENGKKISPFDWLPILPFQKKKKRHRARPWKQWHAARRGTGRTGRTLGRSRSMMSLFYGSGSSHPDLEEDLDARLPAEDGAHVCRAASKQPRWAVCLRLRCLFYYYYLRRLLHPLYICQQISVRGASVIDYTQPCCFFALPVCEMCCPFFTCIYILGAHAIFILKTFDFFWKESSRWTDLSVHKTKAVCYLASNRVHVLHYWSSVVHDVVQRVVVSVSSSVLSKNSDVHKRDLESSAAPSSGVPSTGYRTARRECVTTGLRI